MKNVRPVASIEAYLLLLCCLLPIEFGAAVELDPPIGATGPDKLVVASEIGLDQAGKQISFKSLTGAAFWNHPKTISTQPGLALVLERGAQNNGNYDYVNDKYLTRPTLTTVPGLYGMRWDSVAKKFREKNAVMDAGSDFGGPVCGQQSAAGIAYQWGGGVA